MRRRWWHALAWLGLLSHAAWADVVEPVVRFDVLVETDRTFYRLGETVRVDVFTLSGDQPVPALLERATLAYLDVTGRQRFLDVLGAFQPGGATGHFVAFLTASLFGVQDLEVQAAFQPAPADPFVSALGAHRFHVGTAPPVAAPAHDPGFVVDIEFVDLPPAPTVCDTIKMRLSFNRVARLRVLQLMPDGVFRDILIPMRLAPRPRWIKFAPGKFDAGEIVLKAVGVDDAGNEASDTLTFVLGNAACP